MVYISTLAIMNVCGSCSVSVVGRCVPTFVTELIDQATGMITANNTEMIDKLGNTVNGTELEKGVELVHFCYIIIDIGAGYLACVTFEMVNTGMNGMIFLSVSYVMMCINSSVYNSWAYYVCVYLMYA